MKNDEFDTLAGRRADMIETRRKPYRFNGLG